MSIFYEIGEPVTLDLIMAKLGGVAGGSFGDLRASICMQFALCKWTQRNRLGYLPFFSDGLPSLPSFLKTIPIPILPSLPK